ncbi:phosphorylcholine transferase LicD [Fibrobacter sp. UWEL]|uniref:LicD family protein n=1 Tax=Fibrobacter sp. UWEL TaxID=1896209 RepID=UPI000922D54B|nr:LicD family protein [Fibrobacter sp. UWEL]SHK64816.1 lipopolysaccharide cholinephosphotransferase [Fibrobacter sp. UWEL]
MKKLSMRDVQRGSLEILKKIDSICKQENLRYCLAYGTLIGAVRHKGFIPWDDDIDIMMPRKDYNRLIEFFFQHQQELQPFEMFNNLHNDKYPYMITRISDSRYVLDVDNEMPYGIGLFVDVYPLDGCGNSVEEYKKKKNKSSLLASLCFLSTRKSVKRENTASFLKYLLKYPAFIVAKIIGKEFFMRKLDALAAKSDYEKSDYIGCLVWASDDGLRGIFPKEWFNELVDIEFENFKFKAPREYDKVLKHGYGNYMELPPENKRIAHHYYDAFLK